MKSYRYFLNAHVYFLGILITFSIAGYSQKDAVARIDANQNVILENQNLRMVFERNQDGYTAAVVSVYDGKQWRKMAVSRPIGHVAYTYCQRQDG